MQKIGGAMEGIDHCNALLEGIGDAPEGINHCNALLANIEDEIVITHNLIRDNYRPKFPELESLLLHPIDYARVVKKIGNETDLTRVDLQGLLPSATIMVVSVTASTTSGSSKPLPDDVLQTTIDACDRALALETARQKVLDFLKSRMGRIAPNLCALVGGAVAAKLVGMVAGGLSELARMLPSTVRLLGAKKTSNLAGFSTASTMFEESRAGCLEQTEILRSTPPSLRMRACRLLAAKSVLAARVDSIGGDLSGKTGTCIRAEIYKKIDKWQELPPPRQPKPLPIPRLERKRKRGGRRSRKTKERYAMTELQKEANRMPFAVPEESAELDWSDGD